MKTHSFSFKRFLTALIFIGVTILFFYFNPEFENSGWVGFGLIVLDLILLYRAIWAPDFYCADCGNFLGHSPGICDRCDCNIYTRYQTGVGPTYRDGGLNDY